MPRSVSQDRLTTKQRLFVREYMRDLNASQAAIRAGYSKKTAGSIGQENLKKPAIKAALDRELAARNKRVLASADWVLEKLQLVAERSLAEVPFTDQDGNPVGVFTFDAANANRSLELLGKHHRLFVDRQEISVTIQAAIEFIAQVNAVIVRVVKDETQRQQILDAVESLIEESRP